MAWIIPAIQAVYGIVQGNKAGKRADQSAQQQQGLIDAQVGQINMLKPYQQSWLHSAKDALDPVTHYWMALAMGDRQAMAQALNPEMSQIDRAYQGRRQTLSELTPRGSGLLDRMSDDQFKSKLGMQINARPNAMGQLGALGTNYANMGMGAAGQVLGGLGNASGQQGGMTSMWGNLAGGYGAGVGQAMGDWLDYLKDNTWTGKKRA